MDRLGRPITAIAREKAAIIERGDLAVTGATRRRAGGHPATRAATGRAADRGRAGADSSAGTATGSTSSCPASGRPGSACAAGTRRPTSRSPMRSSMRSRRPGSRPSPPAARRARLRARRVWPGRLELLRGRGPRRAARRRAQPGRRGGARRSRSTTCGRSSRTGRSRCVTASMADKDVDGVVAALACSRGAGRRDRHRARAVDAAARAAGRRPRRALAGAARRPAGSIVEPDPVAALDRALAASGRPDRSSSPVRSISSARRAAGWSTIRTCATPTHVEDA